MTTDPYPDLPGAELPGAATGVGAAGEPAELDEADSRLLAALSRPARPVVTAAEDQPRTARTAREDSGAPPPRRARGPLAPVFQEPS